MKRSEIKILIVEDDPNVGKALNEGLKRCGYSAHWAKNPEEALAQFKISDFQVVILDCMLPKKNGVELGREMRSIGGEEFKIIFTSGIFKDKQFAQDAIDQTKASGFLPKPFNIDKIRTMIESFFSETLETEREPLFAMMGFEKSTLKEVLTAINSVESLHGFHLPWVYSQLSFNRFSGRLYIQPSEREPCTVVWESGSVIDLQMLDRESYFGVLLVEMGFTSPEEVEQSLASQGGKPIGQLLIDANALSPHAINIVRSEQLAIRLSKTIQETSVALQISEESVTRDNLHLTGTQFSQALQDWVSSKLNSGWLSHFYLQWLDSPVMITQNLDRITRVKEASLFNPGFDLLPLIDGKTSLQTLIDTRPDQELPLLRAIHYGVLERIFYFGSKQKKTSDFKVIAQRLRRLAEGIDKKSYYEVLGLTYNAKLKEISKAYLDLAKVYHPDKIDPHAPSEVKALAEKVFSHIAQAHDTLKDDNRRAQYKKEQESGQAHQALLFDNQFDQAKTLLSKGKYQDAEAIIVKLIEAKFNLGQTRIHLCWARMKLAQNRELTLTELAGLQDLIGQIPPEDRHCSAFFYIKGLFFEATGDLKKAVTFWRNATAVDPKMLDAKRDLNRILHHKPRQSKSNTGEWTSLVSNFFKK